MNGLIIEGVTGAGKSSVIAGLGKIVRFELFDEDATFDDFMGDLERDRTDARRRANERMNRILDAVAPIGAARPVLLERFHFSHAALDDDWEAYDEVDARCCALGFALHALERSQRRRIDAVRRSRLETLTIETDVSQWHEYAAQIVDWIGWPA